MYLAAMCDISPAPPTCLTFSGFQSIFLTAGLEELKYNQRCDLEKVAISMSTFKEDKVVQEDGEQEFRSTGQYGMWVLLAIYSNGF
jgi:hypothetical protein